MYASSAGKSGGEFYTPQEVSELLARITVVGKTEVNKVYDPACGSGSLLLKFAKVLGHDNVRQGFFGQEINLTTYNLCRINMFLHDINYEKFDIAHGDTLTDPAHWDDEPFEAIVSNPPYSIKWDGDANPLLINDPRFAPGRRAGAEEQGRPGLHHAHPVLAGGQRHRGDRRVPRRALPRRRRAEDPQVPDRQQLRRRRHPAAARPVLRHHDRDLHHRAEEVEDRQRDAVHRRLGRVRAQRQQEQAHRANQQEILDAFIARGDVDHFARLVDNAEIAENGYNIAVSSYVEEEDNREAVDITELNAEIARIVARQQELRTAIDAIVADLEGSKAMKAVDANLLELLKKSTQFVVPIYQRVYSWGEEECRQLWEDVVRAGARTDLASHFTGSIVYIEKDQGTTTATEPDLIIDGQQRITTVTLLLAALAEHLDGTPRRSARAGQRFRPREDQRVVSDQRLRDG